MVYLGLGIKTCPQPGGVYNLYGSHVGILTDLAFLRNTGFGDSWKLSSLSCWGEMHVPATSGYTVHFGLVIFM